MVPCTMIRIWTFGVARTIVKQKVKKHLPAVVMVIWVPSRWRLTIITFPMLTSSFPWIWTFPMLSSIGTWPLMFLITTAMLTQATLLIMSSFFMMRLFLEIFPAATAALLMSTRSFLIVSAMSAITVTASRWGMMMWWTFWTIAFVPWVFRWGFSFGFFFMVLFRDGLK